MTDDELARADTPELAFRIALDATHDRKALIRIAAWTTDILHDKLANMVEWLQYQWPFLPELDLIELWAGNDEKLTDLTRILRMLSCAAIPAAIAAEVCLRAGSLSSYGLGFGLFAVWLTIFTVALRLAVPCFYKRKVARMTEAGAVAIIHERLVKGAVKYPERVPLLLKLQRRYFAPLLSADRPDNNGMDHDAALTWTWTARGTKQIRIDTEARMLHASDSSSLPETRSFSLIEAFSDARMLFIDKPEILAEVLRALAAILGDELVDVRLQRRRAFWLALGTCTPLHLQWTYPRTTAEPAAVATLDLSEVSALCTAPPPDSYTERVWQSLDDLFFFGPREPGIPASTRAELIAAILSALRPGSGLDAGHAFPQIDHASIAPASWSWNQSENGESGASVGGPSVVIGYQYGHDYGWGAYPVERVLTGAPELSCDAPAETWAAIIESIRPAVRP